MDKCNEAASIRWEAHGPQAMAPGNSHHFRYFLRIAIRQKLRIDYFASAACKYHIAAQRCFVSRQRRKACAR